MVLTIVCTYTEADILLKALEEWRWENASAREIPLCKSLRLRIKRSVSKAK